VRMMKLRSLIDDKKKQRVREAIAKGDTSIFGKKKAEPEQAQPKRQKKPDPGMEAEVDGQLLTAIIRHDPDAVREAIEKGAFVDLLTGIPGLRENGTVLALAVNEWQIERNRSIIDKPENWKAKEHRLDVCKKIIELLVTSGADPNVTLHDPILSYFKHRESQIYELLKKHGAKE